MMKKSTYSLLAISTVLFGLCGTSLKAQTLFNNGGLVYVTTGAVVIVNGGLQDDNVIAGPGVIDNEGDMTVTSLGTNPGNIWISNTAILQGNGKYHLEQDWINDAVFTCGTSLVDMYGSKQELITSNLGIVTTFDTLLLQGAGAGINRRKQQNLDAIVIGVLELRDRVLFTAGHTMFVNNTALNSVTNNTVYTKGSATEGFVASNGLGSLSRMTANNAAYFYPVGADSVPALQRYRKVMLTPATAGANTYNVRLANHDATNDGDSIGLIDSNICKVNPLFYHIINHPVGVDNASIDVFYDASVDGIWSGMAQWSNPTAAMWNDMGAVTYTPAAPYSDVLKNNWNNFAPNDEFILDNNKPIAPTITCNPFCQGTEGTFTANADSGGYIWTVPVGDSIWTGQGTGTVTVGGNVTGPITVVNKLTGCSSKAASCVITIIPSPTVGFDTASSGIFHTTWAFTDTSKPAVTSWFWTFGDGDTANIWNPAHVYPAAGTYVVTETVTNAAGCKATKTEDLTVPEGIIIPNVFTPNGDGFNDVFNITSSGVKMFTIEIFNRWGEKMFESTSPQISWDGRTTAGVRVSDGTYYFILKATAYSGKVWDTHGYLQVITGGGK
jgi:gliding motility-associated-like protein